MVAVCIVNTSPVTGRRNDGRRCCFREERGWLGFSACSRANDRQAVAALLVGVVRGGRRPHVGCTAPQRPLRAGPAAGKI
jgi:hypothetical protein